MTSPYKIYVRDSNFNKVAEIDDYQQLVLKPTFNLLGMFTLTMPADSSAALAIIQPKAGIIVNRNGTTIFSGPVNQRNRKWTMDEDVLTLDGYDDNIFLQSRLALPTPSGPPYTDYDVRTGPTETVLKQYINYNIGNNATGNRKINITTDTDLGRGLSITGRARFQDLLTLSSSLALQGGDLGFRVVQVGNGLQFQVYQPTDKTQSVFFSPLLGNLLDFEYTEINPTANYFIAGGTGTGASRTTYESGDSDSISTYGRYESFLDKRDTTATSELQQSVNEALSNDAVQTNLSITPVDTDGIQFMRDYQLGDKVSVILTQPNSQGSQSEFQVIQDVIRQVVITISPDGELIQPAIGTPDSLSKSMIGVFRQMKKFDKRLNNLERV